MLFKTLVSGGDVEMIAHDVLQFRKHLAIHACVDHLDVMSAGVAEVHGVAVRPIRDKGAQAPLILVPAKRARKPDEAPLCIAKVAVEVTPSLPHP